MKELPNPYSKKWLWKLAVMIAAGGVSLALWLPDILGEDTPRELVMGIYWITFLASGICLVCATAGWWVKR